MKNLLELSKFVSKLIGFHVGSGIVYDLIKTKSFKQQ